MWRQVHREARGHLPLSLVLGLVMGPHPTRSSVLSPPCLSAISCLIEPGQPLHPHGLPAITVMPSVPSEGQDVVSYSLLDTQPPPGFEAPQSPVGICQVKEGSWARLPEIAVRSTTLSSRFQSGS